MSFHRTLIISQHRNISGCEKSRNRGALHNNETYNTMAMHLFNTKADLFISIKSVEILFFSMQFSFCQLSHIIYLWLCSI